MNIYEELAGSVKLPRIEENIPDKVTVKELREALEEYAKADREWKDIFKISALLAKEEAGANLYRLAKAILKNNGFYTYRDAAVDSLGDDTIPSPEPEDFE